MTHISHQATVVAIGGRGLMIEGEPGVGKSSLAHALIDRGAILVGDDGVLLESRSEELWALPHPETRGLLEIRNVGLIEMPVCPARVALILTLVEHAPRYVEAARVAERGGCSLPHLLLYADSPVLHLRAEAALTRHGLTRQDFA